MRTWPVLLLIVTVLVSGCTAGPTPVPTPESQPAAAAPRPADQQPAVNWCDANLPWPEREKALIAALPGILGDRSASQIAAERADEFTAGAPGSTLCLQVTTLTERDALLISTRMLPGGGAVFADHSHGRWTVMPVQPPAPDWGVVEVLYFGVATPGAEGPDLIFIGGVMGSSGVKTLWRGRPSESGSFTLTPASPAYWKTGFRFLSADYVMATQRAEELGPVLETCNACQPTKQSLLTWSGDRYVEVATRVVSTPYMAANLFLGAVQVGETEKALTYAAHPALVEKARTALSGPHNLDGLACRSIDDIEIDNWNRLPAAFQKALPPALHTCSIKLGGAITLEMRRDPAGWVVADVTP
jgi:hypothetical protein